MMSDASAGHDYVFKRSGFYFSTFRLMRIDEMKRTFEKFIAISKSAPGSFDLERYEKDREKHRAEIMMQYKYYEVNPSCASRRNCRCI